MWKMDGEGRNNENIYTEMCQFNNDEQVPVALLKLNMTAFVIIKGRTVKRCRGLKEMIE